MIRTDGIFDASAQTITFIDPIDKRLLGIINNDTRGVIIYNSFDSAKTGTLVGLVLTLDFDTTSMADSDDLKVFYSNTGTTQKVEEQSPLDITGLATSENQESTINQAIKDYDILKEFINSIKKEESGEINTIDENLRMVLGTERLITSTKKLNVNAIPDYFVTSKMLAPVTNSSFMMDVTSYSSLAIQLSGTWTGTITFECSSDGGNFIALNGIAVNGTAIISTATANGIYRFNVAGLIKVQVRFSTATSGTPIVQFIASPETSSLIVNTVTIAGAVTTTDSILPTSITTQANPAKIIPVAPTLPTSGINNFLASYFPQIFQRLRVESAGSNRVPFKQEDNTDKILTSDDNVRLLLQNILRQLEILNIFKYQELERNGHPNLKIPDGFNEN
jgi:hypothetical protein